MSYVLKKARGFMPLSASDIETLRRLERSAASGLPVRCFEIKHSQRLRERGLIESYGTGKHVSVSGRGTAFRLTDAGREELSRHEPG